MKMHIQFRDYITQKIIAERDWPAVPSQNQHVGLRTWGGTIKLWKIIRVSWVDDTPGHHPIITCDLMEVRPK